MPHSLYLALIILFIVIVPISTVAITAFRADGLRSRLSTLMLIGAMVASYAAIVVSTNILRYSDYQLGLPELLTEMALLCTVGLAGSIALWFSSRPRYGGDTDRTERPQQSSESLLTILGSLAAGGGIASLATALAFSPWHSSQQSDLLLIANASSGLLLPTLVGSYFLFMPLPGVRWRRSGCFCTVFPSQHSPHLPQGAG